jgi:hypothetical protein
MVPVWLMCCDNSCKLLGLYASVVLPPIGNNCRGHSTNFVLS